MFVLLLMKPSEVCGRYKFSRAEDVGLWWQFVYLVGHRYVHSFAIAALILYSLMGCGRLFCGLQYLP